MADFFKYFFFFKDFFSHYDHLELEIFVFSIIIKREAESFFMIYR
jgi:hypothetical protein